MKNQHILFPLVLVVAAIIVGTATIGIGLSGSRDTSGPVTEVSDENGAEIAIISVSADQSAAAAQSGARIIMWSTKNYPENALVTINLIKKVSDVPASYEFVRALATETANDGSESWTPEAKESGESFYVEVVCAGPQSGSCRSTGAPVRAF